MWRQFGSISDSRKNFVAEAMWCEGTLCTTGICIDCLLFWASFERKKWICGEVLVNIAFIIAVVARNFKFLRDMSWTGGTKNKLKFQNERQVAERKKETKSFSSSKDQEHQPIKRKAVLLQITIPHKQLKLNQSWNSLQILPSFSSDQLQHSLLLTSMLPGPLLNRYVLPKKTIVWMRYLWKTSARKQWFSSFRDEFTSETFLEVYEDTGLWITWCMHHLLHMINNVNVNAEY